MIMYVWRCICYAFLTLQAINAFYRGAQPDIRNVDCKAEFITVRMSKGSITLVAAVILAALLQDAVYADECDSICLRYAKTYKKKGILINSVGGCHCSGLPISHGKRR